MNLKMKSFNEMRQRGFGLLDVILASVLLLGALAGIIVLFTNANLSANVTETGRVTATMSSEIRGLYRTSSNFDGLTTQQVIDAEIAPSNLIIAVGSDEVVQTPFGGATTIEVAQVGTLTQFDVTFSNLRVSACERLSVQPTSSAGALGVDYEILSNDETANADCAGEQGFTARFNR